MSPRMPYRLVIRTLAVVAFVPAGVRGAAEDDGARIWERWERAFTASAVSKTELTVTLSAPSGKTHHVRGFSDVPPLRSLALRFEI